MSQKQFLSKSGDFFNEYPKGLLIKFKNCDKDLEKDGLQELCNGVAERNNNNNINIF